MEGQWLDGEAINEKVVCQQSCGAERRFAVSFLGRIITL
jgi:hypothetical protein